MDALKRRLEFGDKEQIAALRKLEVDGEFAALPACFHCNGRGYCCDGCRSDCGRCDGTTKDPKAYRKFRETYQTI